MPGDDAPELLGESLQWSFLQTSAPEGELSALSTSLHGSASSDSTCDSATLEFCKKLTQNTPTFSDQPIVNNTTPVFIESHRSVDQIETVAEHVGFDIFETMMRQHIIM
jgi:hypothetical protein